MLLKDGIHVVLVLSAIQYLNDCMSMQTNQENAINEGLTEIQGGKKDEDFKREQMRDFLKINYCVEAD